MDLVQLYKKHDQDKEVYNSLRDKTWANMKQRHDNLIGAFQSKENLPEGLAEKIDQEIVDYTKEWAVDTGTKYIAMKAQHKMQIEAITKFLEPKSNSKEPINDNKKDITANKTQSISSKFMQSLSGTKELNKQNTKEMGKDQNIGKEDMDRD